MYLLQRKFQCDIIHALHNRRTPSLSFALHGGVCCSRHEFMAITGHNGHARTDGYFMIESHLLFFNFIFLNIYIYSTDTAFLGYLNYKVHYKYSSNECTYFNELLVFRSK